MCKVLNARKVGKRTSTTQIYIGRPSKWGNPFVIGRDLVCWCAPLACHGDVLVDLANRR
jgi:hypothetical protein